MDTEKSIVVADDSLLSQTLGSETTAGNTVSFVASGAWTAAVRKVSDDAEPSSCTAGGEEVEWISVSPDHGDAAGEYEMEITLLPNDTGAERKAEIKILCGNDTVTVSVTQRGEGSPSEGNITMAEGTQLNQTVSAESVRGESPLEFTTDGAWTAVVLQMPDDAEPSFGTSGEEGFWISVSPDHGDAAGAYTMDITLQPNDTGADRKAVITIKCGNAKVEAYVTQQKGQSGVVPSSRLLKNVTEFYEDSGYECKTSLDIEYDSDNRVSRLSTFSANMVTGEEEGEASMCIDYGQGTVKITMESDWRGETAEPLPGPAEAVGGRMVAELTGTLNADGYMEDGEIITVYYAAHADGTEYVWDKTRMECTARYSDGFLTAASWMEENCDPEKLNTYKHEYECHWGDDNMTGVDRAYVIYSGGETHRGASAGVAAYDSGVKNAGYSLDLNWLIAGGDTFSTIAGDSIINVLDFYGRRSNYLVSRITDTGDGNYTETYNYTYRTDSEGYVTGITVTGDATRTYSLIYY